MRLEFISTFTSGKFGSTDHGLYKHNSKSISKFNKVLTKSTTFVNTPIDCPHKCCHYFWHLSCWEYIMIYEYRIWWAEMFIGWKVPFVTSDQPLLTFLWSIESKHGNTDGRNVLTARQTMKNKLPLITF